MDPHHRNILLQLRESIVEDVDVRNGVINQLKERFILSDEHIAQIQTGDTTQGSAAILLDILPNCGSKAFMEFLLAVEHNYHWISDEMKTLLINGSTPNVPINSRVVSELPISPLTVPRDHKIKQLKSALTNLEPGGYVVLHGMKGFGKYCLTASTLKDTQLVQNLFNNQVYWIRLGPGYTNNPIEDEILSQLNGLYHRVTNATKLALVPESGFLKEELITKLKYYFDNHQSALLILNDVWDKKIIDAFDFNCKTLVITTNVDLLGNRRREVVGMIDGFTEKESLGLFAEVLDIEIDKLPEEARSIHYECNGMPILIAMFAAQFREFKFDMRTNSNRWRYYLQALRRKDRSNKVIDQFLDKQHAIFDLCISQLNEPIKFMYRQLVIFGEDVNITPATLTILWNKDLYEVEEHMVEFCRKSLAAQEWNKDLNTYIYGVHDLLLCHLKKNMSAEELRNHHRSFIEEYRSHCNGDFSKLPNDNYGYLYIGYHLEQAKMYEEFTKLYTDLNFIQAKIYNSGLSDLLIDFTKYRDHITRRNPVIEKQICDWEQFLKTHSRIIAEHRKRGCLDLVQLGINYAEQSYIYQIAHELALARPKFVYLTYEPTSQQATEEPTTAETPTPMSTANFTDNPNQILIGNKEGNVILWDIETKRQTPFIGHTKSIIIKVIVSRMGDFFLALNDEGMIKRFNLKHDNQITEKDQTNLQSPREKQTFWKPIHRNPKPGNVSTYSIEDQDRIHVIEDMALSSDDKKIAACTKKGTFQVWNINGDVLCRLNGKENYNIITFARISDLLSLVDSVNGVISMYRKNEHNEEYSYEASYRPERRIKGANPEGHDDRLEGISGRKMIYFNEIPAKPTCIIQLILITDEQVLRVEWQGFDYSNLVSPRTIFITDVNSKLHSNTKYVAGTLTHDGEYFIIGDSEGFIEVWQMFEGVVPFLTYIGRINVLDTYWCSEENCHLIMGGMNQVTYSWKLTPENLQIKRSPIKPRFDAVMKPLGQSDIVAQVIDKKIGLFVGQRHMVQSNQISGEIISLCLSQVCNNILYVVKRQTVYEKIYDIGLYNADNNTMDVIKSLKEFVPYAKFIKINGKVVIVWKQKNCLGIKFLNDSTCLEMNTGEVIGLHSLKKKYIITVAVNEEIDIWTAPNKDNSEWHTIFFKKGHKEHENITFSAINPNEDMLAVLSSDGYAKIYLIMESPTIDMRYLLRQNFEKKLTCCSFSPDGKYLAIGMNGGEIVIFDLLTSVTYKEKAVHCNAIRQLCWAPIYFKLPILMSLNCDEIAWWNINLMDDVKNTNRRSRTGMSRSSTTPILGMSPRGSMRLSQSHVTDLTNLSGQLQQLENGNSSNQNEIATQKFWDSKEPKFTGRPSLLGLIQLPQSSQAKVCVSADFEKFLLVDAHGRINTIKFFQNSP